MKVPVTWLTEYCDPGLEPRELAERLAMTGTEVERVTHHGVGEVDAFVVGRVLEAERHPDADRLTVCRVSVGEGDVAQIVCGAPNVRAGQVVAVARPGAVMPDGSKLGKAKLRGVESAGMILAEDELGIGTDHAGIIELEDDSLEPGTPLADVLPIATDVLELEITPNRPDCLAVYGVARELHAATGAALAPPPWRDDSGSDGDVAGVEIVVEAADLCPRFTVRAFEDVKIGPSPEWLKARLMAAGMRPISNVVDITNYVMLLTGQPLHAFDLDRVAGGRLVVRRARDGETMETLDGAVRELDSEMVVIDDADGPTSIAGVMGGARSEVGEGTTRVLLEAATWIGPNIHRTSLRLGLRSEASGRFEKQLQPEQAMEAQAVATALLVEVCGARVAPGTIDVGGPGPEPPVLRLRHARMSGLLGLEIPPARAAEILEALEFEVTHRDDGLEVRPPAFRRADVTREADVIEEVARIHGLEHLPATLPARSQATGRLEREQRLRRRAQDVLADRGLHEIAASSLVAPDLPDRLRLGADDPRRQALVLENPMSEDRAVMRTTLLGSLLDVARHNAAHGTADVALFEIGGVYLDDGARDDGLPDEREHLGALLTGSPGRPSWRSGPPPAADFFAIKGYLAGLLDALRVPWAVEPAAEPFLHPGRSAVVLVAGKPAGWIGELHPLVARAWDVEEGAAFELDVPALWDAVPPAVAFADIPAFPSVLQDLAVVVAADVPVARVIEVIRAAAPSLATIELFDVYRGEQVGEGRVSLALHCEFRAADRTLTDEEVAGERQRITAALETELGASLRA
jgi:phenylalanyl-tRNA synthetase beta chain